MTSLRWCLVQSRLSLLVVWDYEPAENPDDHGLSLRVGVTGPNGYR